MSFSQVYFLKDSTKVKKYLKPILKAKCKTTTKKIAISMVKGINFLKFSLLPGKNQLALERTRALEGINIQNSRGL